MSQSENRVKKKGFPSLVWKNYSHDLNLTQHLKNTDCKRDFMDLTNALELFSVLTLSTIYCILSVV